MRKSVAVSLFLILITFAWNAGLASSANWGRTMDHRNEEGSKPPARRYYGPVPPVWQSLQLT